MFCIVSITSCLIPSSFAESTWWVQTYSQFWILDIVKVIISLISELIVGETYTGSIAEIRTWKNSLSASKFKQHIFDKKSVVGNTMTASRDELISSIIAAIIFKEKVSRNNCIGVLSSVIAIYLFV